MYSNQLKSTEIHINQSIDKYIEKYTNAFEYCLTLTLVLLSFMNNWID